uniref:Uncharacterized protein n=1 Tax=Anguilla anguilla TaxID=7936 RepID=A0A0E9TP28_ANGAN
MLSGINGRDKVAPQATIVLFPSHNKASA